MFGCTGKRALLSIALGAATVFTGILLTSGSTLGPIWWLLVLPMRFLARLTPSYKGSFYPDVVVYSSYGIETLVLAGIYFAIWSALTRQRKARHQQAK
jgi:hypothetical protein